MITPRQRQRRLLGATALFVVAVIAAVSSFLVTGIAARIVLWFIAAACFASAPAFLRNTGMGRAGRRSAPG